MSVFEKVGYYRRFVSGMHDYLRTPLSSDWEGLIRAQLEDRHERWLHTIRQAIFDDPTLPYAQMFQLADCSYDDLAASVHREGLESTLKALFEAGVYLTHDEFKGNQPIVRSGIHVVADEDSYANPLVSGGLESRSSGSRSRGTKTRKSGAYRSYASGYRAIQVREFGLSDRVLVLVNPILPSSSGLSNALQYSRLGCRLDSWYSNGGHHLDSAHYRALTNYLVILSRLHGVRFPFPTHLPANDFSPVAERVVRIMSTGRQCVLKSSVSSAVRVAAAALEKGLDIRGTLFLVGGEALTEGKRRIIESVECDVFPGYTVSEVGYIGLSCQRMSAGNSVHLFRDSLAVIEHEQMAPLSQVQVNSLLFTTLLPTAPNLLINAEMGDSGWLESADCDCAFSSIGFTQQLRDINSYSKLTGLGVTLVGTDIVEILEQRLPDHFGGDPTDYQLVEQEGPNQTQLVLRVSPSVRISSAEAVREFFLEEIRRFQGGAGASRLWADSDALKVTLAEPLVNMRGKVLPLHLLGSFEEKTHAS